MVVGWLVELSCGNFIFFRIFEGIYLLLGILLVMSQHHYCRRIRKVLFDGVYNFLKDLLLSNAVVSLLPKEAAYNATMPVSTSNEGI